MNRNNNLNIYSHNGSDGENIFFSEDFYQVYPMTAKVTNQNNSYDNSSIAASNQHRKNISQQQDNSLQ